MMHNRLSVLAAITLLPSMGFAKAGPEIPRPTTPLCEAVRKVEDHFYNVHERGTRSADEARFIRECIVLTADYTNVYRRSFEERPGDQDVKLEAWSWVVTLVHPRQNDHTWVFQLRSNGTIKLLSESI